MKTKSFTYKDFLESQKIQEPPEGSFSASDFAKDAGIGRGSADCRLRRAVLNGTLKRVGYYKRPGNVRAEIYYIINPDSQGHKG